MTIIIQISPGVLLSEAVSTVTYDFYVCLFCFFSDHLNFDDPLKEKTLQAK